jgi:hypothetical protein
MATARSAPANALKFVIAKEACRLRQSTAAIDQLDHHVASLLAMTIGKWFTAPITKRLGLGQALAMTVQGSLPYHGTAGFVRGLAMN